MLALLSNALLYSIITYLAITYNASIVNIFILCLLIIALVAGSSSSTGAIFPLFLTFSSTTLILLIYNLSSLEIESLNILIFLLSIFSLFFIISGYKNSVFLKSYIQLEEKQIKTTKNLKELNNTLESRIKEEITKNRDKEQHLIAQSRLAQMGEMISMIAHQWRQPLSAISSASSAITLKAHLNKLDDKTAIELSNHISEYSQYLSSTINDFRNFFNPDKKKKNINLTKLVEDSLKIIEISLINIELIKKFNSDITFHTFPNEIKQVILNIIKNAEDILIDNMVKDPTIYIETDNNTLIISDNGGGIPDDIIDNIFDPYFSTKMEKNGTGLGLYMSKLIIEKHCKGRLSVSNNEYGAIFVIELNS